MTELSSTSPSNTLFGHPRGLVILFLTEMWERFSYYGMRGLLIFYLTQHFLFSDERSTLIYGAYTALVFVMTIIGGILADRYLGTRKAVTYGALLLVLGHAGMAVEGPGGESAGPFYTNMLYLSLALIITGVGFLKANISSMVGELYGFADPRRDSGFTIFYMGINLGSFLASILCGYLGTVYGWKYGFGLAGIGMLAGLSIFLRYQHWLDGHGEPPDPQRLQQPYLGPMTREHLCYLTGLGIVTLSMTLVMNAHLINQAYVGISGLIIFAALLGFAVFFCHAEERSRMLAALYFIVAQIPFWALFEQAGSSLNLFTDRLVNRSLFGFEVPAPVFQSLNAAFIISFAPLLAWLWVVLERRNLNPSTPVKFALGVFMAGLGFLVLVTGIKLSGSSGMTAVYFIFLIYWIHTLGELLVSPLGLSAVTKLAPARAVGMTMGAWFLYMGLSNYLSGIIAASTGAETIAGELADNVVAKAQYAQIYSKVGWIAIAFSLVMLAVSPLIKKAMRGAD